MTKVLGLHYGYGDEPLRPSELEGRRKRTLVGIAFDLLFPLVTVAVAWAIGQYFLVF